MRAISRTLAPLLAALAACAPATPPVTAPSPAAAAPVEGTGVREADVREQLYALAADSMEGRETGSRGGMKAAVYLARRLEALGVQPAGELGYFQIVPVAADSTGRLRLASSVDALAELPAERRRQAFNVVGMIPGADPALRHEAVIVGAHYDHVGMGRAVDGDSIYNGADDDASGTSALLEVAEAFASMEEAQRPARSILFLAVSGEEKGLLGSEYYSDHPTVPLQSIVANVNMDMIARNSRDTVVVIGKNYSNLGDVVNRVAAENRQLIGLTAGDDIWPRERFFFRSDHFNFARKEIPAIFFFAGTHEDYHEPSDEVENIDADKAARVARMIFLTTHAIAVTPQRPQWTEQGLREVRRMTGGR
jgi:hypothetical protein